MNSNGDKTLLPALARTTEATTAQQLNYDARGILLLVDVTAVSGAGPSITPHIEAYDAAADDWFTIWTAAAAVTTVSENSYLLYPGASGGNMTEVDGIPLPFRWRLRMAVGSADSVTYSVGAHFLG